MEKGSTKMSKEVDVLISAIMEANLDGVKLTEVEMSDLVLLGTHIQLLEYQNTQLKLDKASIECKYNGLVRKTNIPLRTYLNVKG